MTNLHSTTGHVPNISALLSAYAVQHRGCAGDIAPPPSYSGALQGLAAAAGCGVTQRNNYNAEGGTVTFENPSIHGATTGGVCETPPLYRVT